jgi:UDP:flavonoid glycosyltransferase YjiC (YdhE family)
MEKEKQIKTDYDVNINENDEGRKIQQKIKPDKSLVGFFPIFYSLGEVIPLVKIAKSYMEQGGKAVFFSHGGIYEYLAEEIDCEVIRLNNWWKEHYDKGEELTDRGAKTEKLFATQYDKEFIKKSIEEEIKAFQKTGVKSIVNTWNLTCSISARVLHIPLIVVISGTIIPPYLKSGLVTFPENYENIFTRAIPASIKNYFTQWYILHTKMFVRRFNKFSKKYNVPRYRYFNDIIFGDYNFVCDDIYFLGLTPTKEFPLENFIGPIFHGDIIREKQDDINNEIMNHLKRSGRSILLSMGSLPDKQLFLKILDTLNTTEYNVIAIYTKNLKKDELPKTRENILLLEYVPSVKSVLEQIDLAITHGGRGTIYSVAYSGKPAIVIPLQYEQQFNIDCLVRHGSAIKLSKKYFSQTQLLKDIDFIFDNYPEFSEKAKMLATKLSKDSGEKRAASRLFEITNPDQEIKTTSE